MLRLASLTATLSLLAYMHGVDGFDIDELVQAFAEAK
jgi:hypothetical protein